MFKNEICLVKTALKKYISIFLSIVLFIPFTPVTVVASGEPDATVAYSEDFEDGEAQDWSLATGFGVAEMEDSKCLRYKSESGVYRLSIYEGAEFSGSYSLKVSVNSGGTGGNRALIIFNYVDENNYYGLELQPSSTRRISVFNVINGERTVLADRDGSYFEANKWIDFEIKYHEGGRITVIATKRDEEPVTLFDFVDESLSLTGGKIGVGIDNNPYALFDNISVTEIGEYMVDKTALADAISVAESVYSAAVPGIEIGQYPPEAMEAFWQEINDAKAVYEDDNVTQTEVDAAIIKLNTAMDIFLASKIKDETVDKTALENTVAAAQAILAEVEPGTGIGQYPEFAVDALQQAIDDAKNVLDKEDATQQEADAAKTALEDAVDFFLLHEIRSYSENFNNQKADGWILNGNYEIREYLRHKHDSVVGLGIYNNRIFSGSYIYKVDARAHDTGGNLSRIVFNYQNDDNYYYVEFSGRGDITLNKLAGGTEHLLGSFSRYLDGAFSSKWIKYEIIYEAGGDITVNATYDGVTTELFKVNDTTLTSGKIGVGGYNSLVDFDNIIVKVDKTDTTLLAEAIEKAQVIHDEAVVGTKPGQYPEEAKNALKLAINAAKFVLENEISTQNEIDEAVTELEAAVEAFKAMVKVPVLGDVNYDDTVNVADLALAAYYYGKDSESSGWDLAKAADVNGDGAVDDADLEFIVDAILN